ncbi:MAG: AAA family ATPase [Comamonas sp.]
MNARNDAAIAAVDADVAAALAYRPPVRPLSAPPGPTFPPLEGYPDHFGTQTGTRTDTQGNSVVLTCGTDLNPEPIRWLWPHWLALGKLHILAGAPGQGKTTLALDMAATITAGDRWPDGNRCEKGNILIWSGEDDPADTLLPRLLAAGADRSRCYFIEGARDEAGEVQPFDPSRDLQGLLLAIQQIGGIRLLVIDPVVSAVTGDSHKNTEVRRALQPLVNLATACDCAVLGITHFAKGGQGVDPAQRVVGSVAFTAVARVVMVAAKVKSLEDGQDARILARTKSNIGPDDGGFQYQLEQCEPLPGIQASRIAWGAAVQGTARELLTEPGEEESGDAEDVCDMLRAALTADCWTPVDTAQHGPLKAGFSKKQIWTASKKLGVIRKKGEDGPRDGWYWKLPPSAENPQDSTEDSQDSNVQNKESWNLGTLAGPEADQATTPKTGPQEVL